MANGKFQGNKKPAPTREQVDAKLKEKSTKFVALATKRVNKLLKQVHGVEALSARGSYAYTPEQISKIFGTIEGKVAAAKKKFDATHTAADDFTL
jgi:hypothetical protein